MMMMMMIHHREEFIISARARMVTVDLVLFYLFIFYMVVKMEETIPKW